MLFSLLVTLQLKSDSAICGYGVVTVLNFCQVLKILLAFSGLCSARRWRDDFNVKNKEKKRVSSIRRINEVSKREQTLFYNR